jgi:hypothetical protein
MAKLTHFTFFKMCFQVLFNSCGKIEKKIATQKNQLTKVVIIYKRRFS